MTEDFSGVSLGKDTRNAGKVSLRRGLISGALVFGLTLVMASACNAQIYRDYENHWLLRSFETNLQKCAVRSDAPDWCPEWIGAMEDARVPSSDLSLPEWHRMSFHDDMIICTTLFPPPWCQDWRTAMKEMTQRSPYSDNVANYAARVAADKAFHQAEELRWKALVERITARKITDDDITLLNKMSDDGDFRALETFAWMNAVGVGVKRDLARAYDLYGRALLDGHSEVKQNMDVIWFQLPVETKNAIRERYK